MLIVVGLLLLAFVLMAALQVDDWGRDLTTNRAATSSDSVDPTLRSLELPLPVEQVQAAIEKFVDANAAWTLTASDSDAADKTLSLVRKTRWLGFADDVQVFLQTTAAGTRVDVASQSRVGRGDLGQNPRNIRELLAALREKL